MAVTKCSECGEKVSSTAKTCPHCGAKGPAKKRQQMATCTGCLLLALLVVGPCVYFSGSDGRGARVKPQPQARATPPQPSLVAHKFARSTRGRHQIRAIAPRNWGPDRLKQEAVQLAEQYPTANNAYLVQFFDSEKCLLGWAGTGGVMESQEGHYLGQVLVDAEGGGRLYARVFTPSPYPFE